jgi:DNA-binding NarL/FixJ family response regulator
MAATGSTAVVAERQTFFSAGVAAVLERQLGFTGVTETHDYVGLVEILSRDPKIDFLALDFDLPGGSGLATVRALREERPAMRLAVLTECTNMSEALMILAAGAHGIIPKQFGECHDLLHALQTVEGGGIFVPLALVDPQCLCHDNDDDELDPLGRLTERQQQVIRLLSEGHANKVIARRLGIAPSTVKVHVHAAFRALGVHSRLAALAALRPTNTDSLEA